MVQSPSGPATLELLQEAQDQTFRPPTPPRGRAHESAWSVAKESAVLRPCYKTSLESTPEPLSSDVSSQPGSFRKRVGFVEKLISTWEVGSILSPEKHAPGSGERRPPKSILKRSNGINLLFERDTKTQATHTHQSFASMLESLCQQLAGNDRGAKVDSYQALCGVLRAADKVPDPKALKTKMGLLLQFVERDLAAKAANGSMDAALANEALTTLASFLHNSSTAELLNDDFALNLIEHAIKAFQDSGVSKETIKKLMFVVHKQDFSPKVMTTDRATRLMKAVAQIEKHVSGKSITSQLLQIYRKLIRQSKTCMLSNLQWLEYLFICFQSDLHETRSHAIALGMDCANLLERDVKISGAVVELLEKAVEGHTFLELVSKNLKKFIKEPSKSEHVPQIWAVMVLFLSARPKQLEQWRHQSVLLEIIQDCFNCSDSKTKVQANIAWSRLVYAFRLDDKTSPKWITNLCNPLRGQLCRRDLRKPSYIRIRKATLGNLHNLVYYFLRPIPTHQRLDAFWDQCISKLVVETLVPENMTISLVEARADMNDACLLLTGLLDSTTPKQWDDKRALRDAMIEAKELPSLDPKWVRKSSSSIMPVLQRLIERMYGDLAAPSSAIHELWTTYLKTIAIASVKDVKTHIDTMSFVARFFEMLYRIWQKGTEGLHDALALRPATDFLSNFEALLSTAQQHLGVMPFTEREILMRDPGVFCAISTPSHRPRVLYGEARTPLQHLMALFAMPSPGLVYNGKFATMIHRILDFYLPTFQGKEQLLVLRKLLHVLPSACTDACKAIWQELAGYVTAYVNSANKPQHADSIIEVALGKEYREDLLFLRKGIDLYPSCPGQNWQELHAAIASSATRDAGVAGRALAVIEPLAEILTRQIDHADVGFEVAHLTYFRLVVEEVEYPKDRQALDSAVKRLGEVNKSDKCSSDPYQHLYAYICLCLQKAYSTFDEGEGASYVKMVSTVHELLSRCPTTLSLATMKSLQGGLAPWIHDIDARISVHQFALRTAIKNFWSKISSIVISHQQESHKTLQDLETLILSGFQSRDTSIVNATIVMWNQSFGVQDHLEYPERIREPLSRLRRSVTELLLPSFPDSIISSDHQPGVEFFNEDAMDAQDDLTSLPSEPSPSKLSMFLNFQRRPLSTSSPMSTHQVTRKMPRVLLPTDPSSSNKRTRDANLESSAYNAKRRKPQSTLKHNDSQVEFVPVASSPLAQDPELLTERQREAKERQSRDATIFQEVDVSPLFEERTSRRSASLELPRPRSLSRSLPETSSRQERQATPDVADQQDVDDYLPSSPTPANIESREDKIDCLPPSSPPEQPVLELVPPDSSKVYEVTSWLESSILKEHGEDGARGPSVDVPQGSPILGHSRASSPAQSGLPSTVVDTVPPTEAAEPSGRQENEDVVLEESVASDSPNLVSEQLWRETSSLEQKSQLIARDQESDAVRDTATNVERTQPELLTSSRLLVDEVEDSLPLHYIDKSVIPQKLASHHIDAPAPLSSVLATNDDAYPDAETSPWLAKAADDVDKYSLSERGIDTSAIGWAEDRSADDMFNISHPTSGPSIELSASIVHVGSIDDTDVDNNDMGIRAQFQDDGAGINPQQLVKISESSSNPSMIPETPGLQWIGVHEVEIDGKKKILVNGRQYDAEDTIIVQDPEITPRVRTKKASRKRKFDVNRVDSQRSPSQNTQTSATRSSMESDHMLNETPPASASKRGRYRRKRTSQRRPSVGVSVKDSFLLAEDDVSPAGDKFLMSGALLRTHDNSGDTVRTGEGIIQATLLGADGSFMTQRGNGRTKEVKTDSSGEMVEETTLLETDSVEQQHSPSNLPDQSAQGKTSAKRPSGMRSTQRRSSATSKHSNGEITRDMSLDESTGERSSPRHSSTSSTRIQKLQNNVKKCSSPRSKDAVVSPGPQKMSRDGTMPTKATDSIRTHFSLGAAHIHRPSSAGSSDYGSTPSLTPSKRPSATASDQKASAGRIPAMRSLAKDSTPTRRKTRSTSQNLDCSTSSVRSKATASQTSREAVKLIPPVISPTPAVGPSQSQTDDAGDILETLQRAHTLLKSATLSSTSLPQIQEMLAAIQREVPSALGRDN